MAVLVVAVFAVAPARAAVPLPAGSGQLAEAELEAGGVGEEIRVAVDLSSAPGAAALRVTLPEEFLARSDTGNRFAAAPQLADDDGGRVALDRSGRTVTVD